MFNYYVSCFFGFKLEFMLYNQAVEVYSKSAGRWQPGTVARLEADIVKVRYGDHTNHPQPHPESCLRCLKHISSVFIGYIIRYFRFWKCPKVGAGVVGVAPKVPRRRPVVREEAAARVRVPPREARRANYIILYYIYVDILIWCINIYIYIYTHTLC